MSITTIIKSIKTTNNLDIPNVVTEVQYSIRKNNASVDGFANLNYWELTNDNYIPLSALTEDIVKNWVLTAIGDGIVSIEAYLDNEINEQEEQTKIISNEIKLPWETN
jgi:hypothetical protein